MSYWDGQGRWIGTREGTYIIQIVMCWWLCVYGIIRFKLAQTHPKKRPNRAGYEIWLTGDLWGNAVQKEKKKKNYEQMALMMDQK